MTLTHFMCRTCGSSAEGQSYSVREMMFSSRAEFAYTQCADCQSIQIKDIPSPNELSKFYPTEYYAFQSSNARPNALKPRLRLVAETMRDRGLVGRSRIGRWLARWKPDNSYLYVIGQVGVRDDHNILDVGCGAGRFLDRLARAGFGRLSGVDPFLAADSVTPEGVKLYKRRFVEMDGAFDVIVFNHSFEHLPDPRAGLQTAHRKLSPNGLCLIQMPTPSSQAWAEYGVDWAQWDAPRHLTLMSRRGLPVLARACGFRLRQILDIGLPWSLMASELYRRGIGLRDGALDKHFSRSEFAEFRRRMSAANASGQGDAVSYVLEKA